MVCVVAVAADASAQSRRNDDEKLPPSVPPAIPSLPPSRGIAGRRLDPGAILCTTEQDLANRAAVNARRENGDADPGDPLAGCRIISQPYGVDVVARHGLGRVQVKLKPSGQVGWTDAYLP